MTKSTNLQRESRWRAIIRRQMAGRAGVAEFCRREGIAVSTFHWWRRRLRFGEPDAVEWIEARGADLPPVASAAARSGAAVRIGAGGGLWIEFTDSPSAELLAAAVQALQSASRSSC